MKYTLIGICALLMVGCSTRTVVGNTQQEAFAFGVIADAQWGDKDTAGARHYREALGQLSECVEDLNRRDLAFTIQLGDIIDGNETPEKTASDLDRVLDVFNGLSMPTYHVVGNHCLTADASLLRRKLKLDRFYYDFTVPEADGWRFVVLDGNDAGYGVLGTNQLKWLEATLALARGNEEKVVVFNHYALLKGAARHHRMTEPKPVLELINKSGCVVGYFAGHDHAGGYILQGGIHHVTVKGMVEAPEHNAYAVIEVHSDQLKEIGFGKEPSRAMKLAGVHSAEAAE